MSQSRHRTCAVFSARSANRTPAVMSTIAAVPSARVTLGMCLLKFPLCRCTAGMLFFSKVSLNFRYSLLFSGPITSSPVCLRGGGSADTSTHEISIYSNPYANDHILGLLFSCFLDGCCVFCVAQMSY